MANMISFAQKIWDQPNATDEVVRTRHRLVDKYVFCKYHCA
jgi:hypothetical protein